MCYTTVFAQVEALWASTHVQEAFRIPEKLLTLCYVPSSPPILQFSPTITVPCSEVCIMMTPATPTINEESAGITVDIAPDGDVVFVVGTTERRLRVYSLFVKAASPVLNAMLRPNFKEGHELAETGSVEIALPEDDAEAIEIIFNVIHGRNDKVRQTLSPDEILQVAIASDKYDCFVSLAFAIRVWLSRKGVSDPEELWVLAMAACLFREQEAFAEATAALVFNHVGSYVDLARKHEAVMDPIVLLNTAGMSLAGWEKSAAHGVSHMTVLTLCK